MKLRVFYILFNLLTIQNIEAKKHIIEVSHTLKTYRFKVHQNIQGRDLERLTKDLQDLSQLKANQVSTSPLHYRFFKGVVDGKTYLDWLELKVKGFKKHKKEKTKNVEYQTWLRIDQTYFDEWRQVHRWARLIHLRRHLDGHQHIKCKNSIFDIYDWDQFYFIAPKKKKLCDQNFLGPNGAELVFLMNLKNHDPHRFQDIDSRFLDAGGRIKDITSRKILNEDLIGKLFVLNISDYLFQEDMQKVEMALAEGVSAQVLDRAIDVAMYMGTLDFFKLMLKYDYPKEFMLKKLKENMLWKYDLATTDLESIEFMINTLGYPINHQDYDGNTLLHYVFSISMLDEENVQKMLELGADGHIQNKEGLTPVEFFLKQYPDKKELAQELSSLIG
jgi:ankyrin repeat protein